MQQKYLRLSVVAMRVALGVIFLWFGLLKFYSPNPVYELLKATFSFLADPPGIYFLGALEVLIGLGLIINIFPKLTHKVLILHLLGTFATFFISPGIMFNPHFPFLTLAGEFVIKNLALAIGGLIVLWGPTALQAKK